MTRRLSTQNSFASDLKDCSNKSVSTKDVEIDADDHLTQDEVFEEKHKIWTQVVAVIIIALCNFGVGAIIAYPGIALLSLMDSNSSVVMTKKDAGLFSSFLSIGAVLGTLLSGPTLRWVGQKKLLLFCLPIMATGWLGIGFAREVFVIQLLRIYHGVAFGFVIPSMYSFTIEIAHSNIRGRLASLIDFSRQLGILFVFAIGYITINWNTIALICSASTTFVPFIGLFFLHESPRFLLTKRKEKEARKSLLFYKGSSHDIEKEMNEINSLIESKKSISLIDNCKLLKNKVNVKIISLVSALCFLTFFTGDTLMSNFSSLIFRDIGSEISPYLSTVIIGIMNLFSTVIYAIISDKVNRKWLLTLTSFLAGTCLSILAIYLYFQNVNISIPTLSWVPLVLLLIITCCGTFIKPICYLYAFELVPNSVRLLSSSIVGTFAFVGNFISLFIYPYLNISLGFHGSFIFYSFMCFILAGISYFAIPEAQGKSLEAIENILHEKEKTKSSTPNV